MKNYEEMSSRELRKIGQELKIKGYGSAGKAYLIAEITRIEKEKELEAKKQKEAAEKPKKQKGKLYEYNGKAQTLGQWSKELGIPLGTLNARIKRMGWTIEEALSTQSNSKNEKLYEHNGKAQSLGQWAKELNISVNTLRARVDRLGWDIEKALSTESKGK